MMLELIFVVVFRAIFFRWCLVMITTIVGEGFLLSIFGGLTPKKIYVKN